MPPSRKNVNIRPLAALFKLMVTTVPFSEKNSLSWLKTGKFGFSHWSNRLSGSPEQVIYKPEAVAMQGPPIMPRNQLTHARACIHTHTCALFIFFIFLFYIDCRFGGFFAEYLIISEIRNFSCIWRVFCGIVNNIWRVFCGVSDYQRDTQLFTYLAGFLRHC